MNSIDRIAEIQNRRHRCCSAAEHRNDGHLQEVRRRSCRQPSAHPIVEVVNTMFERFSDAQKHAIDLAVEQSHALIDAMKDRAATVDKATESPPRLQRI